MILHRCSELKLKEELENRWFDVISSSRMLPSTVTSGGGTGRDVNVELFADGSNTPLRAGLVRLPRQRLLDKHFKLGTVPIYTTRKDKSNLIRSFVNLNKNYEGIIEATECPADRFIPRRKGQNLEAAYHSLVVKPPKKPCGRDLDLPNDIKDIGFAWKKRSMARALQNLIQDGGSEQILQLSQKTSHTKTVFGSLGGRSRNIEESSDNLDEYKWPVKPRRYPVLGQPDVILDMPHFRPRIRKSLLDWSSQNMIAAVINHEGRHGVCLVNGDVTIHTDDTQFLFRDKCTAVKFSNSGDKIAIGRESSVTSVYTIKQGKCLLGFKCCPANRLFLCHPQAYDWSKNDRYLIVGCSGGYLTVATHTNSKSRSKIIRASTSEIVAVSFSPNDNYVACCGREAVARIFTWPDMIPFMEIKYSFPMRAMAWHPWESSVLCVGGGAGDGGISIWNIHCHKSLLYRSVNFEGSVDTLAWNKVTGELMVNWFVRERENYQVVMPVYASIDHITDAIVPSFGKNRVLYTAWSPDGSHIACQAKESVAIYNFLDNESKGRLEKRKKKFESKDKSTKSLSYFTLR